MPRTRSGDDHRRRRTTSACCACSAKSAARATARSSSTGRAPATHSIGDDYNRAYGVDANMQVSAASASRRSSRAPTRPRIAPPARAAATTRAARFYNFTNNLWQVSGGYSQVGENFNPEVGFLPRRGYRRPEFRAFFQPQPKNDRVDPPHRAAHLLQLVLGLRRRCCRPTNWHIHPLEIQPKQGGRFGWFFDYTKDNPTGAVHGVQPRRPPRDDSGRAVFVGPERPRVPAQPERARSPARSAIASATTTTAISRALELTSDYRITPKATASVGWTRQDIKLPYGNFVNNLVPIKANYSFTTLDQPVGAGAVQRPDRAVLVERPPGAAQSQRHRPVRGLQRSPRRAELHVARHARPFVRREVHAADRLLGAATADLDGAFEVREDRVTPECPLRSMPQKPPRFFVGMSPASGRVSAILEKFAPI